MMFVLSEIISHLLPMSLAAVASTSTVLQSLKEMSVMFATQKVANQNTQVLWVAMSVAIWLLLSC